MKTTRAKLVAIADLLILPLLYPFASLLRKMCDVGMFRFTRCQRALLHIGVYPIRNHYYEPQFDYTTLKTPLSLDRSLPGIDWEPTGGDFLDKLSYASELTALPADKTKSLKGYVDNILFGPGDAEFWYQVIRFVKPRKIFEIGSGNSTLIALQAIQKNMLEDPSYRCEHICIEPYEMPWLEQSGVTVVRKKVEDLELSVFAELDENDILFIDSSHMIRPQGDVLFEYLQVLPSLKPGVIVHVHDIFSPRNYPREWLQDQVKFWNEQYLLEAFLSHNRDWKILAALNYLRHHEYDRLKAVAPFLTPEREPGSFYIQKIH